MAHNQLDLGSSRLAGAAPGSLSPPVEAVLAFGFSLELVLTTYRRLQGAGAEPLSLRAVSAADLLQALNTPATTGGHEAPFNGEGAPTAAVPAPKDGAFSASVLMAAESHLSSPQKNPALALIEALKAENKRLKERSLCGLCRLKPVSLTLLPCGHCCCCNDCGASLCQCPLCHTTILADVKTFFA